jgi:hypothetical protein
VRAAFSGRLVKHLSGISDVLLREIDDLRQHLIEMVIDALDLRASSTCSITCVP